MCKDRFKDNTNTWYLGVFWWKIQILFYSKSHIRLKAIPIDRPVSECTCIIHMYNDNTLVNMVLTFPGERKNNNQWMYKVIQIISLCRSFVCTIQTVLTIILWLYWLWVYLFFTQTLPAVLLCVCVILYKLHKLKAKKQHEWHKDP